MDPQQIEQVLRTYALAHEPAFDSLHFRIEPITCPKPGSCPLGLYFPDGVDLQHSYGTIIIPPTASEGTLLHELGHRYGHFYYDNLTEPYAEAFRKHYQKVPRAMLYVGRDWDNVSGFSALFEEGEKGAVEVGLRQPLSYSQVLGVKQQLVAAQQRAHAMHEPSPTVIYGRHPGPVLRVEFTQGISWMPIIGMILAGGVVAGAAAMGYAIYKIANEAPWVVPTVAFGLLAGMILIGSAVAKRATVTA